MIYGAPGLGKSVFALYLYRFFHDNFGGRAAYVMSEEGFSPSAKIKIKSIGCDNAKYKFYTSLPTLSKTIKAKNGKDKTVLVPDMNEIRKYNFFFIDSVQGSKIPVDDLMKMRDECPDTTFFFLWTVNKDGVFSGGNQGLHDVCMSIKMIEKGVAEAQGKSRTGAVEGATFTTPYTKRR